MKTLKYLILTISLTTFTAISQEKDSLNPKPFQATFFYPMGTNGIQSKSKRNYFSFNILSGVNGGLKGMEIGGISNVNTGHVDGVQIAGITNVNLKSANGLIISGIINIIKDSSQSICIAGISNIVGGSTLNTGLHITGISNLNNDNFTGSQISGIANLNNGYIQGSQISGISNINNGNLFGTQVSGISNLINGDLTGVQIGLINKSKNVKGFQLGLINVANDFENGVPLGLFNFVKHGYHAVEITTSDAIYANLILKMGVDKLYTVYRIGYTEGKSKNCVSYGLGLGSMINLTDRLNISVDGSVNHIIETYQTPKLDLLTRMDIAFRLKLNNHLSLFTGPTFNIYLSQHDIDSEQTALRVPYSLYTKNWWNNNGSSNLWIGGTAGLAIQF